MHYESARPGEVTRYVADIAQPRALLGYQPQTPFTARLPRALEWPREICVLQNASAAPARTVPA